MLYYLGFCQLNALRNMRPKLDFESTRSNLSDTNARHKMQGGVAFSLGFRLAFHFH